jgi:1-acyl-sn-glycerol-3-phosphate acyltransferase
VVLIFSEGRCINEWRLRPLKKGTARLAISSWQQDINLKVLPVAINYSSFRRFGKNMQISFGDLISKESIDYKAADGLAIKEFNEKLKEQLGKYVHEVKSTEKEKLKKLFFVKQPLLKKILLFLPAVAGYIIHAPLYLFTVWLGNTLIKEEGHFDSKTIGFLFLLYPVFLLLLTATAFILIKQWWVIFLLPLLPFTAWAYVQLKKQLD